MTRILFSFDTEDFVNPAAANGILRAAQILSNNGIRGCFNVVARVAQALVKWGRQDVIDELKKHEIDLHSLAHSHHPTINEYTDIEDYNEAMHRFLENEQEGCRIISEILGTRTFPAACPPGNSTSYVAHYGYAQMGVPVYCGDDFYDRFQGRPIHFCNLLTIDYEHCLDQILMTQNKESIDILLDKIHAEREVCVFYHHPNTSYFTNFWDMVNFNGYNTPEEEWKSSDPRDPKETELFFENFNHLAKKLQSDPRFEIITYEDAAKLYLADKRKITLSGIPDIKKQIDEELFPLTTPDSYCISDILLACRDLLLGKAEHICGTVYGFLDTPYSVTKPVTVTAEEIKASATQIGDGFLPTQITVGDNLLGTADWLRAALQILSGQEKAVVLPAAWQIDLNEFPQIRDLSYKNTWIHSPDLEDKYLSDRYRLQSWTIRLPKGGQRKIF